MAIYLGLGSNLGDRKKNLEQAIDCLVEAGFQLTRVSPLVESPAMLPNHADPSWNKPYLNLVVSGEANWSPEQGLQIAKQIEKQLGREPGPRWSARPMDIDILLWHDTVIQQDDLEVPHAGLAQRDFVITPLMHIAPGLKLPGLNKTPLELSQRRKNIPLWMGILNITPDSFSDGDVWADEEKLVEQIDKLIERDIQIIDVGAESTRPNAAEINSADEWSRLAPVLRLIRMRIDGQKIRPWISLDSRHSQTIEKAIDAGYIDMINDVTGLDDPEMLALARDSNLEVVAMHAMTVPVNPSILLDDSRPATEQMLEWIHQKADQWLAAGIDLDRMIIDPGIGFGKSSIQAYDLMSNCSALRGAGMRLLIGHSRKSFMAGFTDRPAGLRDMETLGISLALCQQGADIIRVHQPFVHQRAYRAWSHITV